MIKKTKLPSFIFDSLNENLTIIWPNSKKEQKTTAWRDKWNNPGFDLDPIDTPQNKKGNWVMFGTWKRQFQDEAKRQNHSETKTNQNSSQIVRLFYKKVDWQDENKIINYYMQEQPKQDQLHFILSEKDLAQKNNQNKWIKTGN